MKIENHLFKANGNVIIKKSSNHGSKFDSEYPDTIVLHYTAGSSAESSVKTLCNPRSKASAHLVVGRDASIWQLVPFNIIAWHAGRSTYAGRSGYNKYSIGIEIDNAGPLTEDATGRFISWFGRSYSEVINAVHRNETQSRFWHSYSEKQIEAVYNICECLCDNYPIEKILGHEEIAPGRKTDPGPAFPLDKLRQNIFVHDRNEDTKAELQNIGTVNANKLNIRTGPGTQHDKAGPPLKQGEKVKIIEELHNWYEVEVVSKGWVSKDYIKT